MRKTTHRFKDGKLLKQKIVSPKRKFHGWHQNMSARELKIYQRKTSERMGRDLTFKLFSLTESFNLLHNEKMCSEDHLINCRNSVGRIMIRYGLRRR